MLRIPAVILCGPGLSREVSTWFCVLTAHGAHKSSVVSCFESLLRKLEITSLSGCACCLVLACSVLSSQLLVLYSDLCNFQAWLFPEPITGPLLYFHLSVWESCRVSMKSFWADGIFQLSASLLFFMLALDKTYSVGVLQEKGLWLNRFGQLSLKFLFTAGHFLGIGAYIWEKSALHS